MKTIKLPYSMLIYDIETTHDLKARIWRTGEQYVGHEQLDPVFNQNGIICIAYKWYGERLVHILEGHDIVERFDVLARQADVCLGKNSDRFDVKHINTQRMLLGLKPYPEWADTNDDLEKQLRKYFAFPSQSLDYISKLLGFGGKVKMERQDWIDISNLQYYEKVIDGFKRLPSKEDREHLCNILFKSDFNAVINRGQKALNKMIMYNKKDVFDTETILKRVLPYIKLRKNAAVETKNGRGCRTCGSTRLVPTKIITVGQTKYQQFDCLEHNGYGGRSTIKYDKQRHKVFGKIT